MSRTEAPVAARLPVVDLARCDGCGQCADVCATGAVRAPNAGACAKCVKYCLSLEVPCSREAHPFSYERCDACGRCVQACPTGAIAWASREAALAARIPAQECREQGVAEVR